MVSHFFTGEDYLFGIDDNNIVATFHVGGVRRFVLTAEDFGNFSAKAAEDLVGGIDNHPVMLDSLCVRGKGFVASSIHF